MALQLKEEFDLEYVWNGEVMYFKRPGVSVNPTLDKQKCHPDNSSRPSFSQRSDPESNVKRTDFLTRTSKPEPSR
ncbi:MAG: hypothetical protein IPL86_16820 [Flavobacteriales bacterium]|nr:hypothetical protein [Flavobacteriales bacterium]